MKIGLVCPYHFGSFGGVQRQVLEWSEQLRKLGHESLILTCGPKVNLKRKDIVFLGNHFPIPANDSISTLSFYLENGQSLRDFLLKKQFDLLHFHELRTVFLAWQILAASPTINVATFHAFRESKNPSKVFDLPIRFFTHLPLAKKVSKFSAVSLAAADAAKEVGGDIEVIPNAIDPNQFFGVKKIKKFTDGMINLLYVGALVKRKGVIYLLKSVKELVQKSDAFRLIIVGQGPEEKKLKGYAARHQLKNVVFVGAVAGKQLPSYYASADIFCAPATHGESFGIVLLEAMASGLPIVAFANEGYKEILKDRPFCDFMVEPKDIEGLSQKLEELIGNRDMRKKLSQAGRKEVQKYSWERVGKRILKFYGEAMG